MGNRQNALNLYYIHFNLHLILGGNNDANEANGDDIIYDDYEYSVPIICGEYG